MNISNLSFFNKFGKNLNLILNPETNIWEGKIYFEGISSYLFDNENIFILENVSGIYKFPQLYTNEYISFLWNSNKNDNEFFIYDVENDIQLNENFISRVESKKINYSDIDPSGISSPLDIGVPLQINIAFNPSSEDIFERTLSIYYYDGSEIVKFAELYFYGEGIEEEYRFKDWAENFGIKFLREDANILKNYDIKEAIPDYSELNRIRKELLVSKDQIYPYIGTYKGLSNFVNILGYKDILQIKEYWTNVNNTSPYFNKMLMIDISDYLDDGKIDTLDLVDKNKNIKDGKQFKKTEFLSIVYQFTRATDVYDDDNIPIVEETTDFTVNEIFYKLNLLNDKLKSEFLPINVKIKDIIGEFIYFQKLTISNWNDSTQIFDFDINHKIDILVSPNKNTNIVLRSLNPLYKKAYELGSDLGGAGNINTSTVNPFEFEQKYSKLQNSELIKNISNFYNEIKDQKFDNLGNLLSWEFGDDPEAKIGAPIILKLDLNRFTLYDLRGVKLQDLLSSSITSPSNDPYWTIENIDFGNIYEINWKITKDTPVPYSFSHRGKITDLYQIAHFLPYSGKYRISIELFDFSGNCSVFSTFVTIQNDEKPEILAFTRLEDKFNYSIKNLSNIQLQDFGSSPIYYPRVNILNNEDAFAKLNIYKNLLEWTAFYKNRYGLGQNIYDAEFYDNSIDQYLNYSSPTLNKEIKKNWGLGENQIPITLNDFNNIKLSELYWLRLSELVYTDDFNAGFYINDPKPGETLNISLFSDFTIPQFNTLSELVLLLNESDHRGINLYNYSIVGKKIHAQAKFLSKEQYHILLNGGGFSPNTSPGSSASSDKYTFFLPKNVFSKNVIDWLKSISPVFDEETLFLHSKTSDLLSGVAQDPIFWETEKYWSFTNDIQRGHLPTIIDENSFNINNIKVFEETFVLPKNGIVFFVVNNIDGKSDFIWTLYNTFTGEEIVRVKSVPFFVWKFKEIGNYSIKIDVINNKNTTYSTNVENFIRVLNKKEYVKNIEDRLNNRKLNLLQNPVQ
jgi:hypothetical protein